MKKESCLLVFLILLVINITGCQNANTSTKRIENTTMIIIGYGTNSQNAIITNKEEVRELEELFNDAEFEELNTTLQQPYMNVIFHNPNEKLSRSFLIDELDIIRLSDGRHFKSEELSFKRLYSIHSDYLSKRQE